MESPQSSEPQLLTYSNQTQAGANPKRSSKQICPIHSEVIVQWPQGGADVNKYPFKCSSKVAFPPGTAPDYTTLWNAAASWITVNHILLLPVCYKTHKCVWVRHLSCCVCERCHIPCVPPSEGKGKGQPPSSITLTPYTLHRGTFHCVQACTNTGFMRMFREETQILPHTIIICSQLSHII